MSVLRHLLAKEFRQIFRNPAILRIIFIMPVIQLVILPLAADYEVKHIQLAVMSLDQSTAARQLQQKITASGYFRLVTTPTSEREARQAIEDHAVDLVLVIPAGFEANWYRESTARLLIQVNAVNGVKANLGAAYLRTILADFNQEWRHQWQSPMKMSPIPQIQIQYTNRFNSTMNYQVFMVPGILVILLSLIGTFLAALNIVREKEVGTIEQINVTPVKNYQFILGKLIPFWLMGLTTLIIGLMVARLVYGIIPTGSIPALFLFAALYQLALLGLGLLISTYSDTQQQALLVSFFLMMVFILLGGLYTSIDSMPPWAQQLTKFNPAAYFIEVMRMIILKGATLVDIGRHILIIAGFALFFNTWAVWSYRKRSA